MSLQVCCNDDGLSRSETWRFRYRLHDKCRITRAVINKMGLTWPRLFVVSFYLCHLRGIDEANNENGSSRKTTTLLGNLEESNSSLVIMVSQVLAKLYDLLCYGLGFSITGSGGGRASPRSYIV